MLQIKKLVREEPVINSIVIYGANGSGKTRFASTLPKPLLLVDVNEGGTNSIENIEDIYVLNISKFEEIIELTKMIRDDKLNSTFGVEFKSIAVDTITQIQKLYEENYEEKTGKKMNFDAWKSLGKTMKKFYRIIKESDYQNCFIFQERNETNEEGAVIKNGLHASKGVTSTFLDEADVVGKTIVTSKGQFAMIIKPTATTVTKIRTPSLVDVQNIKEPDYNKLIKEFKGENNV